MLLQAILLSLAATAFSSRSFLTAASTTAAMAGSERTSVEAPTSAAVASTALLSLRSMMGSRQKAKVENSCCVLGWFCTPDSGGNTWSTIDD